MRTEKKKITSRPHHRRVRKDSVFTESNHCITERETAPHTPPTHTPNPKDIAPSRYENVLLPRLCVGLPLMEGFGGSGFGGVNAVSKKRRSATLRRPRPDSHLVSEDRDMSPPSSTPSSDNASKHYFNGNAGYDASSRKKELNLNTPAQMSSSFNRTEGLSAPRKIKKDDKKYEKLDTFYGKDSSKGGHKGSDLKKHNNVTAPANWKSEGKFKEHPKVRSASPDGYVNKGGEGHRRSQLMGSLNESAENKPRKVKLELSGVTRTIHVKPDNDNGGTSSVKLSRSSDAPRHRQKLILQLFNTKHAENK